jgi:hypothetical protein
LEDNSGYSNSHASPGISQQIDMRRKPRNLIGAYLRCGLIGILLTCATGAVQDPIHGLRFDDPRPEYCECRNMNPTNWDTARTWVNSSLANFSRAIITRYPMRFLSTGIAHRDLSARQPRGCHCNCTVNLSSVHTVSCERRHLGTIRSGWTSGPTSRSTVSKTASSSTSWW